jgi:hypothetical protein
MWWTILGLKARATQWASRKASSTDPGPKVYAAKQEALWLGFAEEAKTRFHKAVSQYLEENMQWNENVDYMSL